MVSISPLLYNNNIIIDNNDIDHLIYSNKQSIDHIVIPMDNIVSHISLFPTTSKTEYIIRTHRIIQ